MHAETSRVMSACAEPLPGFSTIRSGIPQSRKVLFHFGVIFLTTAAVTSGLESPLHEGLPIDIVKIFPSGKPLQAPAKADGGETDRSMIVLTSLRMTSS
jgi:hypothetical protein